MSAREKLLHFLKRKGTESSEESSSIKEQRLQERESEEPVTLQENGEVARESKGIHGSTSGTSAHASSCSTPKSRPILSRLRTALTSKFEEAKSSKSLELQDIANLERLKNVIAGFELGVHCEIEQIADRRPLLSITPSKLKTYTDYVGLFHPVKLLLHAENHYEIRVNIVENAEAGKYEFDDSDFLRGLVTKVSVKSPLKICPGLQEFKYQDLDTKLGYQPKKLFSQKWPWPVNRHVECLIWHSPTNARKSRPSLRDCCERCKLLSRELDRILERRKKNVSSSIRRSAKSTHRIDVLSPASRKIRLQNIRGERKYFRKIARKYWEKTKVHLNEKENQELSMLISEIEASVQGREELDNVFEEAEKSKKGRGRTLKEVWKMDRLEFLNDQRRNVTGKRNNRWSTATFRIAISIYSRSPSAYSALKNLGILQLPCKQQVEKLIKSDKTGAGLNENAIAKEVSKYDEFSKIQKEKGRPEPLGFGAVIFDETKVQSKILFDMNGGNVKGFAMTPEELPFLQDIFESVDPSQNIKTSYILQFIWRDLTSSYSIIGPYFACEKSWDHSFLYDCVMRTVKLFSLYKFRVKVLVCNGASSNLALLKVLAGYKACQLPVEEEGTGMERYLPKMEFHNPYDEEEDNMVYMMICPSHQLKNQIAALYSSRANATKSFEINDTPFGWKAIIDQYSRDKCRQDQGCAPRVPGLRYNFVYRDVWTRLNVQPAKIMQQKYMISALRGFSESEPPPPDAASVKLTADYLDACNLIFERGILSRKMIKGVNSPVLENIKDGFQFFVNWFEKHKEKVYRDNSVKARQKHFLAWQTWDLLRIMVSSFLHYNEWFFSHVPTGSAYFISPIRINGSAIESLFSKLKFGAGGQLSSLNYGSGLARIQAKTEVDRVTESGKGYRDDSVIPETTPVLPRIATAVCVDGRSKPFGFCATEFLFPSSISQSSLGGRNGSNACTLIAIFVGNYFLKNMLPAINSIVLPTEWSLAVVNCINDGNTLYDAVFEGQALNLDVEDAFQNFADELQLGTYDENVCNCTNQDMTSVIGIISQFADAPERKAGVLITEGLTVAVLCFGGGPVAIVDSHQHGGNGALVCMAASSTDLVHWYKKSFQKYSLRPMGNLCTLTWLEFSF